MLNAIIEFISLVNFLFFSQISTLDIATQFIKNEALILLNIF